MNLIIRNAFLPDPLPAEGFQGDTDQTRGSLVSLSIEDGRISAIRGPTLTPPGGAREFDASGLTVTPGWIDIQLNGGFGYDFTEQPSSIWEVAARLPALGLTAFLPTIISAPPEKLERAIQVFGSGPPPGWRGAIPVGLHLEGPFLNPGRRGAHNPAYLLSPDLKRVQSWSFAKGIRMVTLAPELPGALECIRILRENGVVVSGGHTLATYEQAIEAFEAGVTCATHLFNAQTPINHREPGFVTAALETEAVFTGLIADGIHVHPAISSLAWRCKGSRLVLVTDAISALGMPPGEYPVGDRIVDVDATSVRLPDGTLAGSNATPERCIRNLATWARCAASEAAKAMSVAPARLLDLAGRGSVEPGAMADLTLITAEGAVAATIVGGELLYERDAQP